jgi:hypothetical protein
VSKRLKIIIGLLLLLGISLGLQPSGFWPAAEVSAAASKEYSEIAIAAEPYSTVYIDVPEAFSYAFTWTDGAFKLNNSGNTELTLIEEDIDLYDAASGKHSSIMYYKLPSKLQIDNLTAKNIKLSVINPPGGANLTTQTAGGEQTNLASGAHYSDLTIINRAQWGANPALLTWQPKYKTPTRFIIHHTALAADANDYARSVRAIYQFHSQTQGWGDIGYNYLIDPAGNIYEGRAGGDGAIGAHAFKINGGSIGIALLGDFTNQAPTIQATRSLRYLMAERAIVHGINMNWGSTVIGHRDSPYSIKECPGQKFYDILPTITSQAQSRKTSLLAGGAIDLARQIAQTTLAGYQDTRLKINFTPGALASATPSQLTPVNSAIVGRSYDASSATITVESIPGTEGDWSDDTLKRLINLHTIFSLDPNVDSIELVNTEVSPRRYQPTQNQGVEFELIGNPLVRYNGNITLGTGNIGIYDVTDSAYAATYSVSDSARVQIHYGRHLNVYQDFTFQEGHTYRVEVCASCVNGAASAAGLPGYDWQFNVNVSQFSPVHRFWSNALATHFYTPSSSERTKLTTQEPFSTIWNEEGTAFYALTGNNCGKGQRVFRFWSDNFQNHFYTINYAEYEKLTTQSSLKAVWDYEGVAFCAYDYARVGAFPVYRFWSDRFKGHFYTIKESEKDRLISKYASTPEIWRYEKIAFWAMTSAN